MFLPLIIYDYLLWHYTRAWRELFHIWRNYLWFVVHVFSIPELTRSLLTPFKRITEKRGSVFDLEAFASYVVINILSRVIGAIVRTAIIVVGLIALLVTVGVGVVIYIVWVLLPIIIIGLVGASLSLFLIGV